MTAHWDGESWNDPDVPGHQPGAWELPGVLLPGRQDPGDRGEPSPASRNARFEQVTDIEPFIAGWLAQRKERDDRGHWPTRPS